MYSATEDNGTYALKATVYHHFAVAQGNSFTHETTTTNASQAYGTTFTLLRTVASNTYSVRLYNRLLEKEELEQNHVADLCGFYGIDSALVEKILGFDANQIATLYALTSTMSICSTGKKHADAFAARKAELVSAIETADAAAIPEYVSLYVADGLVALYDAYGFTANDTVLTKLNALNLYGAEGYEAYANVFETAGTFANSAKYDWKKVDGGFAPIMKDASASAWSHYNYLNLNSVVPFLGDTYSVQEVFTHEQTAAIIEDGVVTNYDDLNYYGRGIASWIGGINYSSIMQKGVVSKTNGVYNALGMVADQIQFGSSYISHFLWSGEEFGTKAYDVLTANGGEITLNNYYVGAPRLAIERTTSVLGAYTATTMEKTVDGTPTVVDAWEATFRISFAQAPASRSGWQFAAGVEHTAVAEKARISNTKQLLIAGDHATVHSIRIYNKDLNKAELAQNHLADLHAYYGVTTELVVQLPAELRAALGERLASISLTPAKGTDEYLANAETVENALFELTGEITAAGERAITFGGVSYRTSGNYGVRALFSIDTEAIAFLESCGYEIIAYGAIVGVGVNGETTVNASAEDLTVALDEETGKVKLASGTGKIVSTDAEGGLKYLTEDNVSFALTTTFAADGSQSEYYSTTLIYRGFLALEIGAASGVIYFDANDADLAEFLLYPFTSTHLRTRQTSLPS